jgi:hypothetical protein
MVAYVLTRDVCIVISKGRPNSDRAGSQQWLASELGINEVPKFGGLGWKYGTSCGFYTPVSMYLRSRPGRQSLVVHPCCYSSSANSGCKTQARTSHGKVTDEVPDQGDELQYRGNESEDR